MSPFDFGRLFRAILSPNASLDVRSIEKMGLLATKIAQMYSVRPDLVGVEKCGQLSRLLQQVTPLPEPELRKRFELLAPPAAKARIRCMHSAPLSVASLGQVHRATLEGGREVVVKILREDDAGRFQRDAAHLRRWLRIAVFLRPALKRLADPLGALAAVEKQTIAELNFLSERDGAKRLQALACERIESLPHLGNLRFPEYFTELSSRHFLVTEFIDGPTLSELINAGRLTYETLLELFRIHGYFLFVRGEFHGDLHPGNVIFRDGQFWFLDNASVETIPPQTSRGLFQMLCHIGGGDLGAAAQALAALSRRPLPKKASEDFCKAFENLYRGFVDKTVAEASLTYQMMQTIKLAVCHKIDFPPGAFPLIKSLMYLDGMVLRAAPHAKLLRDVSRFAGDFLERPAAVA